jgi:hypothetical protein
MIMRKLDTFLPGRFFLILGLIFTLSLNPKPAQAQFSSPSLWLEKGVWLSAGSGYAFPVSAPMWAYHAAGFMANGSVEFPGAYFNYGVDLGMHNFPETGAYQDNLAVYPVNFFATFNLARFYSNNARRNVDKKQLLMRTGLGAGGYIHSGMNNTKLIPGLYLPLKIAYQHSVYRVTAEFRFHTVFGRVEAVDEEGNYEYGTASLNFAIFFPY